MSTTKEITKGVFWIAVAKYSGIVISLIVSAILARMISPSAFGTIAVAMVILLFLNVLSDIGIGTAIVQFKQLTRKNLSDIFTITVIIGFFLSVLLYYSSGLISDYYSNEILSRVCKYMCIVIFFNSLNIVPNGLMRKAKRFKAIAIRTLFFRVLSGSIAIWGAFHGWEIYALLVSPIVTSIGVFLVNYYNYPQHIVYRISRESIIVIFSYSFYQFLFSFINYFSRHLDKLLIGKYFSMEQLGYYDKSYHLMMLPVQNISFVIDPVLHPVLSSFQDKKEDLMKKNEKLSSYIANLSFPIGVFLFLCGGEIIRIVYGERWVAAIPVFQILALSLPLQIILSTINPIFQSSGHTKTMFYSGILNTSITVTGFIIAIQFFQTIEAVGWSWDITLLVNFVNSYLILYYYVFRHSSIKFFQSLVRPIVNSFFTFLICFFFFSVIQVEHLFFSFLLKSFVILSCTLLFAKWLKQYDIKEIAVLVFKKI